MSEQILAMFSADGSFYAVPDKREASLVWLSVVKRVLPVPIEWRRPDSLCAFVMRGRDYYRLGVFGPLHTGASQMLDPGHELVKDYRDAAWWTPGLEEAWVELEGLHEALERATTLHVCTIKPESAGQASLPVEDARASAPAPPHKKEKSRG